MNIFKLLILTITVIYSGIAQAETYVIVNNSLGVKAMSEKQVTDIYMERVAVWENGNKIESFALNDASPVEDNFCKAVYGSSAVDTAIKWQSLKAQNRLINPPKQVRSEKSMIRTLKRHPNGIGFVGKKKLIPDTMGVVFTIK